MAKQLGVRSVVGDQCMYGLTARADNGQKLRAKKRTKFMTNIPEAEDYLGKQCDGTHGHQHLIAGRAKVAEVYSERLSRAMARTVMSLKCRLESNLVRVL